MFMIQSENYFFYNAGTIHYQSLYVTKSNAKVKEFRNEYSESSNILGSFGFTELRSFEISISNAYISLKFGPRGSLKVSFDWKFYLVSHHRDNYFDKAGLS